LALKSLLVQPLDDLRCLDIPEVVALLRVSRAKVYELLLSGELKSIHIGARHLVPVQFLREFLASRGAA
jgi:excisionase family DNA binding protein